MASGDGENSSGFSGKRAKLVKETSFFPGATPGELKNSDILQRTKQALREGFMESGTERAVAAVANEISLVRRGPFYHAQQALGLIQANHWDLGRRIGCDWVGAAVGADRGVESRRTAVSAERLSRACSLTDSGAGVAGGRAIDGIAISGGDEAYPAGRNTGRGG